MNSVASELCQSSWGSSPFQRPLVLCPWQNPESPLTMNLEQIMLQVTVDLNLGCMLRTEKYTAAWLPFPEILV